MKIYDSYEAERLRKLISHKEDLLSKINPQRYRREFQLLQREIVLLKNEVLPIILNSSVINHSEFAKYAIRCYDEAINSKCNGLLFYHPIDENYTDTPIIGLANIRSNLGFGNFGAMEIFADVINMDGNKAAPSPIMLPVNFLI